MTLCGYCGFEERGVLCGTAQPERCRAARDLRSVNERIAFAVASVHGVVTRADTDARARLERVVGRTYDAVNRQWTEVPS